MGKPVVCCLSGAALLLLVLAAAHAASAGDHAATFLIEDVYTAEGTTTNRDVDLEGETVKEAWFNFTVFEDELGSDPDSFLFAVTNMDDASLTRNMPGTTDAEGRLSVPIRITTEGAPSWRVSVTCNQAGDTTLGPVTIEEDGGNPWSLQVDYVYWVDEGGNGGNGGNGGDGGDGEDDEPALVLVLELDLLLVALASIVLAFLSMGAYLGGEGSLKLPLVLAGLMALDCFVFLPVALVVNHELNGTTFAMPPVGPAWLGNMALVLLLLWAVPFVVARKRVMGSDEVHGVVSRLTSGRLADGVRRRAQRFPDDPLPARTLALLMVVLGIASVAVVAYMLLNTL